MKVRILKSWQLSNGAWTIPGETVTMKNPLPYLDAGLVVPVRKREIETAIRKAPETQVIR